MSKYRRIARVVARRAFDPGGGLEDASGAEVGVLVQELCDTEDADWLLEENEQDRRLENFRRALEWVLESYADRRMTPPLEQTTPVTFFRFTVSGEPEEAAAIRETRARLRLHEPMLSCLRSLEPDDFEKLCGKVLDELGCEAVHVTRSSQDLGSDFFGRLPASTAEHSAVRVGPWHRVLGSVWFLLFGQAKRYAEYITITLDTIKLVEPTWNDILRRKQADDLPEHLDEGLQGIGWRPGDAVRYMFVTTSRYTGPALKWAEHAGMITLDGDQLAQLLLESEIGVERAADGESWTTSAEVVARACA